MAKLRFKIAMSLDGFTAGPEQSKKNPLAVNESTRVVEESLADRG